jgi:undecaprenyl-diphosphatase
LIVLATIPAVIIAVIYKDNFERAFSNPETTAYFLLVTSLLLLLGEIVGRKNRHYYSVNWLDSLIIGFFQVLALLPGISRSGATISGGLIRNLDRDSSARFSFLMAVPIMIAAGSMAIVDLFQNPQLIERLPIYFGGFISAGVVGYFSIKWFIAYLSSQSLYIFSVYCAFVGILMLFLLN